MANFRSGLIQFGRSDLGRALAISLALHAMVLLQGGPEVLSVWPQRGLSPTGISLDATLRGKSGPPAATPAWSADPAVISAAAPRTRPPPAATSPPRLSSPGLLPGSARPSEIGGASGRWLTGPDTASFAGPAAAPVGEDGRDADGLRQYRLSLASATRRFKRYPPEALEQHWSGTAQVRVAIAASGLPQSVELLHSSGHEVLDAVALDMLGKAALNAAVPASLRGRPFSVPLPVEFRRDLD